MCDSERLLRSMDDLPCLAPEAGAGSGADEVISVVLESLEWLIWVESVRDSKWQLEMTDFSTRGCESQLLGTTVSAFMEQLLALGIVDMAWNGTDVDSMEDILSMKSRI